MRPENIRLIDNEKYKLHFFLFHTVFEEKYTFLSKHRGWANDDDYLNIYWKIYEAE